MAADLITGVAGFISDFRRADRPTDWPDDLCEIVYVDHFGNAMTGLRAAVLPREAILATARVECWGVRGPSALGRLGRLSGMRTRTGLPKSLSIRDARTAISVLQSALRSR